jgi:hypothetical protein
LSLFFAKIYERFAMSYKLIRLPTCSLDNMLAGSVGCVPIYLRLNSEPGTLNIEQSSVGIYRLSTFKG